MEEEETQAPPQGNLSQRLYNDPSCPGRGFSPAQPACRTTSFARSRELYWRRHVGWNCSHCWDPRLWERQPHSPRSDGSGSSSVSPLLSSHSQGFMAAESLITSHAAADAQTGRLQVGEQRHRCQAGAGPRTSTPAHQWWARGQWSSREKEEDREKPARRERAGPGCQSGIQIQPPARRRRRHPDPPSPPPAPGCRGQTNCKPQGPTDQGYLSSIYSSLSFSMKSVLYKGVMDAGEHAA